LGVHPYLVSIGLYYEPTWLVLICTSCGIALCRNTAYTHVKNHHPVFRPTLNRELLSNACQQLEIEETMPDVFLPIAPISGLPIHTSGLLCPFVTCNKVYGTPGSMDYHHRREHPELPKPMRYTQVHAQRFDNQKRRSYFQVHKPQDPARSSAFPSEWLTNKESFISESASQGQHTYHDARELNDFLRVTKWPAHIQRYNPAELRHLVRDPEKKEIPWLRAAVLHKLRSDVGLIEETPLLIRQRLNTADPQKG
jgi:hypothetical protein